jgi:hypothetical protein
MPMNEGCTVAKIGHIVHSAEKNRDKRRRLGSLHF